MKKILFILFFIPNIFIGQNLADKDYYLVDSLVLEELTRNDRILLDSCLAVYSLAKNDTSRIYALNFICDNLVNDVWSDYQFVLNDLIEESLKKDVTTDEEYAIELVKGGSLNNLGLYYEYQKGNISKALELYLQALKLFEKLEDKNGEAMLLNRIGTIYTNQDNVEKGFEYYKKSFEIYQSINEQREIANPLNNLGSYYKNKKDFPTALDYYQQSLAIDIKINNKQGAATLYSNIGRTYTDQGKYSAALISFIKGLAIFEEMGDQLGLSLILNNMGQVYYLQGDFESAFHNANNSYKISKKNGYPSRISSSALLLSSIYEKQNKPVKALEMFRLYTSTKDSMINENTKADAVRQQSKYEYETQKAIDDAIHDKQITIEQEAKEKQQIITYATGFGLSLVAVFLIFVGNRLQVTRKQKALIESQKKDVEQAHEELSEKNKEILDSINYAKRIQTAILPPDKLVKEYLENSFILYKPKDIVAGDFYWMKTVERNEGSVVSDEENNTSHKTENSSLILFAAADCTGHGVPGAMVSVVCSNGLNRSIKEYRLTEPGEILDKTREIVIEEFSASWEADGKSEDYVKDGMDIALCSLSTGNDGAFKELKYAGANNPLWIIRKGELLITKANKQPIGSFRSSDPFTTHSFDLEKSDTIYIFSDGYADQFGGEKGKKFKAKALRELLLSIQDKPMDKQRTIIDETFEAWRGDIDQLDDVCLIGVRI